MNLGIIRKLGNMAVTVSREGFHRYKYNTHEIAHDLKPYKLYKTISLTEIPKKHMESRIDLKS
jgi:hypothetical protein